MCTSIGMNMGTFYFGRNLDLECGFGEKVVFTPRNFPFRFRRVGEIPQHFAMIGMATVMGEVPLYAEAVNEKGLAMAGLNFPGNAFYPETEDEGKANISPFELIWWILGQCETLAQARELLENTHVIGLPFGPKTPLAPLHWHISDATGSLVLEVMKDGQHLYENPIGVLTNNPPFPFHLANVSQYMNLTAKSPENKFGGDLKPFGQGMGAVGLPGDFSPASRFVKASFLKLNAVWEEKEGRAGELDKVTQFFHILDGVAMVRGSVLTPEGKCDLTRYSCCVDAARGIYYYKTYENNRIAAIDMGREDMDGDKIKTWELDLEQEVREKN